MQTARHIDQDVARDDRQAAAGALGLEWQLTVDADGPAVDRPSEVRQRQIVVCQPNVAGPAREENALTWHEPRRIAQGRLRGEARRAGWAVELDISREPASRAARHERPYDAELGVNLEPDVVLDPLRDADAAAADYLGARATPVEVVDGERAF